MPDKYEFARVTLPEFAVLVPERIYNEAIISLGILEKGIPCGVICASFENYQYKLSWLYIDEKKRKKGYATALLTEMLSVIRTAGETYPMNMSFTSMDSDLLGFFSSYEHFYVRPVGEIYNIPSEFRNTGETYSKLSEINGSKCRSYYQYDSTIKDSFLKRLRKRYPQFANMVNEDIEIYEPELSFAYGKKEIRAAVFCKISDEKEIDVSFIYSEDAIAFGMVLVALIDKIENNYQDHALRIICVNDKSRAFVWKLFSDAKPEYLLQADWDLRLPGEYPAFNN